MRVARRPVPHIQIPQPRQQQQHQQQQQQHQTLRQQQESAPQQSLQPTTPNQSQAQHQRPPQQQTQQFPLTVRPAAIGNAGTTTTASLSSSSTLLRPTTPQPPTAATLLTTDTLPYGRPPAPRTAWTDAPGAFYAAAQGPGAESGTGTAAAAAAAAAPWPGFQAAGAVPSADLAGAAHWALPRGPVGPATAELAVAGSAAAAAGPGGGHGGLGPAWGGHPGVGGNQLGVYNYHHAAHEGPNPATSTLALVSPASHETLPSAPTLRPGVGAPGGSALVGHPPVFGAAAAPQRPGPAHPPALPASSAFAPALHGPVNTGAGTNTGGCVGAVGGEGAPGAGQTAGAAFGAANQQQPQLHQHHYQQQGAAGAAAAGAGVGVLPGGMGAGSGVGGGVGPGAGPGAGPGGPEAWAEQVLELEAAAAAVVAGEHYAAADHHYEQGDHHMGEAWAAEEYMAYVNPLAYDGSPLPYGHGYAPYGYGHEEPVLLPPEMVYGHGHGYGHAGGGEGEGQGEGEHPAAAPTAVATAASYEAYGQDPSAVYHVVPAAGVRQGNAAVRQGVLPPDVQGVSAMQQWLLLLPDQSKAALAKAWWVTGEDGSITFHPCKTLHALLLPVFLGCRHLRERGPSLATPGQQMSRFSHKPRPLAASPFPACRVSSAEKALNAAHPRTLMPPPAVPPSADIDPGLMPYEYGNPLQYDNYLSGREEDDPPLVLVRPWTVCG